MTDDIRPLEPIVGVSPKHSPQQRDEQARPARQHPMEGHHTLSGGEATGEPETIFEEAERIVGGSRLQDYGGVRGSFDKIAAVWGALLGIDVTGEQVALCMIGMKLVRESHNHKRDNLVDVGGYARCLEKMTEGEP